MQDKKIRDAFLDHQQYYKELTHDDYSAAQLAAIATETEFGITKDQLIAKFNGK